VPFQNSKADLFLSDYVDKIMEKVMEKLEIPIPAYQPLDDIVKKTDEEIEWTIPGHSIDHVKKLYHAKLKRHNEHKKRRNSSDEDKDFKSYYIKRKLAREQQEILQHSD
jgi:hypothetical protein